MAKTNLKAVSVYVTDSQNDLLTKAAAFQHRSLSNFLLSVGLQAAEELGFAVGSSGPATAAPPAGKRRAASV